MIRSMALRSVLLAALLVILPVPQAGAIIAAPETIDWPVPTKWRAPFAKFLMEFGVTDVDATVEASSAWYFYEMPGEPEQVLFRVNHLSACTPDRDRCLTIIGRIEKDKLIADAMFMAGARTTRGDTYPHVLGSKAMPPVYFISRDTSVSVIKTVNGLLILEALTAPDLPRQ